MKWIMGMSRKKCWFYLDDGYLLCYDSATQHWCDHVLFNLIVDDTNFQPDWKHREIVRCVIKLDSRIPLVRKGSKTIQFAHWWRMWVRVKSRSGISCVALLYQPIQMTPMPLLIVEAEEIVFIASFYVWTIEKRKGGSYSAFKLNLIEWTIVAA